MHMTARAVIAAIAMLRGPSTCRKKMSTIPAVIATADMGMTFIRFICFPPVVRTEMRFNLNNFRQTQQIQGFSKLFKTKALPCPYEEKSNP
jgi:hypothetical protein